MSETDLGAQHQLTNLSFLALPGLMVPPCLDNQVRKALSWPRNWANSSLPLYTRIPIGMYGATCIFRANLTPFPLQEYLAPSQPWLDGVYAGEGVVRQIWWPCRSDRGARSSRR